jgi:hypothetical protein
MPVFLMVVIQNKQPNLDKTPARVLNMCWIIHPQSARPHKYEEKKVDLTKILIILVASLVEVHTMAVKISP